MAKIYYDRAVRYFDFYTDILKLKLRSKYHQKKQKEELN